MKQSNPITGLDRPTGFQEAEVPRFHDKQHMKVERLSALSTGHLHTPRYYSWFSFMLGHVVAQWLRHCGTNQKVAGSIPDGVIGIFY
jgi:hypothetical protein